ncbi:hypothetical protein LEMLEM_LOCUS25260 [Lemmus lemmus]
MKEGILFFERCKGDKCHPKRWIQKEPDLFNSFRASSVPPGSPASVRCAPAQTEA